MELAGGKTGRLPAGARPVTGLLASVTDVEEARLGAAGGADIIDLKNPAAGALGALAPETLRAVRTAPPPRTPETHWRTT